MHFLVVHLLIVAVNQLVAELFADYSFHQAD
jgi:hypothetical protein